MSPFVDFFGAKQKIYTQKGLIFNDLFFSYVKLALNQYLLQNSGESEEHNAYLASLNAAVDQMAVLVENVSYARAGQRTLDEGEIMQLGSFLDTLPKINQAVASLVFSTQIMGNSGHEINATLSSYGTAYKALAQACLGTQWEFPVEIPVLEAPDDASIFYTAEDIALREHQLDLSPMYQHLSQPDPTLAGFSLHKFLQDHRDAFVQIARYHDLPLMRHFITTVYSSLNHQLTDRARLAAINADQIMQKTKSLIEKNFDLIPLEARLILILSGHCKEASDLVALVTSPAVEPSPVDLLQEEIILERERLHTYHQFQILLLNWIATMKDPSLLSTLSQNHLTTYRDSQKQRLEQLDCSYVPRITPIKIDQEQLNALKTLQNNLHQLLAKPDYSIAHVIQAEGLALMGELISFVLQEENLSPFEEMLGQFLYVVFYNYGELQLQQFDTYMQQAFEQAIKQSDQAIIKAKNALDVEQASQALVAAANNLTLTQTS